MRAPLAVTVLLLAALVLPGCNSSPVRGLRELVAPIDPATEPVPAAAQARFDQGLAAMQAGRWSDALSLMADLWQDYPWLSGPPLDAALSCLQLQRPEEAERWFGRALEINPGNLDARNAYAIFLREQGRFGEAEAQYLEALATDDADATTHYNLGILYDLYLGRKPQALAHYSRYQELSGGDDRQMAGWIADLRRQLDAGGRS
ncbi:tetratricopeptide repeat protein [Mangrovimicrobium sediminis]|uniref:Tetratricopeptide repeat protein n=1 Tax=Mangrovimicrobium sediminis TaxID=2562682 RepID=A0A4Z0M7Y5_9GAMM|nr:tetratricopeptide repeat protein [Haliea sp. SAOS-164]TGD75631.1 tetratricopeptide repeat protein [Haliea sp. SAOS-164]